MALDPEDIQKSLKAFAAVRAGVPRQTDVTPILEVEGDGEHHIYMAPPRVLESAPGAFRDWYTRVERVTYLSDARSRDMSADLGVAHGVVVTSATRDEITTEVMFYRFVDDTIVFEDAMEVEATGTVVDTLKAVFE